MTRLPLRLALALGLLLTACSGDPSPSPTDAPSATTAPSAAASAPAPASVEASPSPTPAPELTLDLPATEVPSDVQSWVWESPSLLERTEDRVAKELGMKPGEVLIDYPSRDSMLSVDLPLRTRGGRVEHLTEAGRSGTLGLPRVADELYRTARRFRVFTAERAGKRLERILAVATLPADEVEERLKGKRGLLE